MSDNSISLGNFEAVHELTENDNFHTSIYESDYKGLLIARCNQNGKYPHQAMAILNGLNGKQASAELVAQYASRISQQDAELERLRREVEEARKYAENLAVVLHENYHYDNKQWKPLSGDLIGLLTQIDNMTVGLVHRAEARKAAFIEAAEIAEAYDTGGYGRQDNMMFCQEVSREIANLIRAKSEETGR